MQEQEKKLYVTAIFSKKYFIWVADSKNDEISNSFKSNCSVRSQGYIDKCIKYRLVPFIQGTGSDDMLFWPNLVTKQSEKNSFGHCLKQKKKFIQKFNGFKKI